MRPYGIEYEFEELPHVTDGDGFWSGMNNGVANIEFDTEGEWIIESIHLIFDNHKSGKDCEIRLTRISPTYQPELWNGLRNALECLHGESITDLVWRELEYDGVPHRPEREMVA